MIKNESGFTLIELLITLMIIGLFVAISSPILITLFEKQTEKQFLALFKQDILLLQNNTIDKYEYNRIIFRDDHYELMFNDKNIANIVRHYPIDLSLSYNNTPIISFNDTGTIINPGTLKVKSKYTNQNLVFPFGRGRFYVKE